MTPQRYNVGEPGTEARRNLESLDELITRKSVQEAMQHGALNGRLDNVRLVNDMRGLPPLMKPPSVDARRGEVEYQHNVLPYLPMLQRIGSIFAIKQEYPQLRGRTGMCMADLPTRLQAAIRQVFTQGFVGVDQHEIQRTSLLFFAKYELPLLSALQVRRKVTDEATFFPAKPTVSETVKIKDIEAFHAYTTMPVDFRDRAYRPVMEFHSAMEVLNPIAHTIPVNNPTQAQSSGGFVFTYTMPPAALETVVRMWRELVLYPLGWTPSLPPPECVGIHY